VTELNEEMMEVIRERAFDALVSRALLEQEVRQRKVTVADDEILNVVRYSPPQEFLDAEEFQTDGEFDYDKYHEFIRDPRSFSFLMDYERRIRENLPLQKLQLLVLSSAKITDWQVRREFLRLNEEVQVEYLLIPPDRTHTVTVSDDEISQYYAAHEEDLLEPEKAAVSYVFFDVKPSEEDEQLAKERIQEVYDEAISGVEFAELAQYYSEDPGSASEGGDLGWFPEGTMAKEFDSVVFSLKVGEISEPFKTSHGWHVAKLTGHKRNEVRASHILMRISPSMQTLEEVRERVREFMQDTQTAGFEEAASEHALQVYGIEEFSLETPFIPGFGMSQEIQRFILENAVGKVSYPIVRGSKYYVLKIVRKKPRQLPDLETISAELEKRIRADKQRMHANEKASDIRAEITDGQSLKSAAQRHGLELKRPEPFTRVGRVPGISQENEFFGAAFALHEGEVSAPVETDQGYFILKVLKKFPIDEEEYEEAREDLRLGLFQMEQQQVYLSWIENLRAMATVKDHRRKSL
jgi:parvulin-like peptidyl-prolyl isomerase